MEDKVAKLLEKSNLDYVDIRYEEKTETKIHFSGRDLKEIGSNGTDGYVIRVLHGGGMAGMTVTRFQDIKGAISLLKGAARLASANSRKPTVFADVPVIKAAVKPKLGKDPRKVPIEEKLELLESYNKIILERPEIFTTDLNYFEVHRCKHFMSSEGTDITEALLTVGVSGEIVAKRSGDVRNVRVSVGGSTGMGSLIGREKVFLGKADIVRKLLKARSVKGGNYNVVLNPGMTGVFAHEAFGHLSEADSLEDKVQFRKRMRLGAKLGSKSITIIADPTIPGNLGYYRYDDEGVASRPVTLLDKGVLAGRLHSRKTAASFGEEPTGHCISEDHDHLPIVRMGNIFVKPGNCKFEELLEGARDGLYLCDAKGGQTNGENFTFGTQYGYIVKNGELGELVRDTNLMGNLFTALGNIEGVDRELVFTERGGCGKGVQYNIKSSYGAPNMLLRDAIVGGE